MAKNKNAIIGICVALVVIVAGAGYFMSSQGSKIEEQVRAYLANSDAKVGSVEYSSSSDTLTLKDVQYQPKNIPHFQAHAEEIVLKKLNVEAFNAATAGLPSVAESVIFTNVKGSFKSEAVELDYTMSQASIKGWHQHLGKIMELQKKELNEAYFDALLDIKVDSLETKDYVLKMQLKGEGWTEEFNANLKSTEVKNISKTQIESYILNGFAADIKSGDDAIKLDVEKTSVANIKIPSPAFWSLLAKAYPKIIAQTLSEAELEEILLNADTTTKLFTKMGLELKNVNFELTKAKELVDSFAFQDFAMHTDFDTEKQEFLKFDFKLLGLVLPLKLLPLPASDLKGFTSIYGDNIAVDGSLALDLKGGGKDSTVEFMIGAQKAAHITSKLTLILPEDLVPRLFEAKSGKGIAITEEEKEMWSLSIRAKDAEILLKDEGFMPSTLAAVSKMEEMPPADIWEMIFPMTMMQTREALAFLDEGSLDSIEQCVSHPGALTLKATPKVDLAILGLFLVFAANPTNLGISASCVPGEEILKAAEKVTLK